jgi:cyclic pyranopterin phosphate synthase
LPAIVAATKALPSNPRTAMTSNGLGLKHTARALADAGLDRVNISLDTTDPATFETITRRDRLDDVVDGLAAASKAGLAPVKVNAVLLRGINDVEAPDLLRWCIKHGYELRFIEQMPLDAQHGWNREAMVTADETLAVLSEQFTLTGLDGRGSAPAEKFLVDDGPHTVGIIGSVTRPFCGDCNRVRLTADGQIRNCLFARDESDLRGALRAGASDQELAERWIAAMATKLPGHGIDDPTFLQPTRPMSSIGG